MTEGLLTHKWQLVQKLKQQFRELWNLEYLTQIQQRAKWFTANEEIHEGNLLLIRTENCPSMHWPLGRITALHPGAMA